MDDPRQALSEVSKEFVEIAVYGDRLRNLQQSLVSLRESIAGRCRIPFHGAKYGSLVCTGSRGRRERPGCPPCSQNAHGETVLVRCAQLRVTLATPLKNDEENWGDTRNARPGKSGRGITRPSFLLAEAASECAPSMRAMKDSLATP